MNNKSEDGIIDNNFDEWQHFDSRIYAVFLDFLLLMSGLKAVEVNAIAIAQKYLLIMRIIMIAKFSCSMNISFLFTPVFSRTLLR